MKIIGGVVVLDANTMEVVETSYASEAIIYPYTPGLYTNREVTLLKEAFGKLKNKPDIIISDSNEVVHPRMVSLANHLGIELDIPTIGCANKILLGQYDRLDKPFGSQANLYYDGHLTGRVLRSKCEEEPIYVTIGHKISLDTSTHWILKTLDGNRLPKPISKVENYVFSKLLGITNFPRFLPN